MTLINYAADEVEKSLGLPPKDPVAEVKVITRVENVVRQSAGDALMVSLMSVCFAISSTNPFNANVGFAVAVIWGLLALKRLGFLPFLR